MAMRRSYISATHKILRRVVTDFSWKSLYGLPSTNNYVVIPVLAYHYKVPRITTNVRMPIIIQSKIITRLNRKIVWQNKITLHNPSVSQEFVLTSHVVKYLDVTLDKKLLLVGSRTLTRLTATFW